MRDLIAIGIIPQLINDYYQHQHHCWEIIYYTHGAGIVTVGNDELSFQAGDIVCLPPGIPHSEKSPSGYRNVFFSVNIFEFAGLGGKIPRFKDNESSDFYNILLLLHKEFHIKLYRI